MKGATNDELCQGKGATEVTVDKNPWTSDFRNDISTLLQNSKNANGIMVG